jgi:hypothetical protein
MSATRTLATRALNFVVRHSSSESQEWANAMLRELDFIENDWAALFWALGSTSAIFRNSGRRWMARIGRLREAEAPMVKSTGPRAAGIATGVAIAVVFVLCVFGVVYLLFRLFPAWDLGPVPWWVALFVIPEIIFVFSAVMLWRKRKSMALGILLTAVAFGTHFIIHVTNHGNVH